MVGQEELSANMVISMESNLGNSGGGFMKASRVLEMVPAQVLSEG